MVLPWENLQRFLWCWSWFCCCYSSFVDAFYSHLLFDIIPHPSPVDYHQVFRPILYFQPSPLQSNLRHFHFSTIPLSSYRERYGFKWAFFTDRRFLPYAPCRYFGTTCFYQGFHGSQQLFFQICRASYWSPKHRPGPSVYLIHSNPQSFIHLKFVIIHVNIVKVLLVVKALIKKYTSAVTLFSSHKFWMICSPRKIHFRS